MKKILLEHHVLDKYRIDLYFPEHRIAIVVDKFNHVDRIIHNGREEERREYPKCKFIMIDPDKNKYDEFVELGKIIHSIGKSKIRKND